jgi:MraZ protein
MASPSKTLFVGTFRHLLDAKNRLTIPSRWRFEGDEGPDSFLALPQGDHVLVLPPAEIERLYEKLAGKALSDADAQASIQKMFALASSFGCDKQGRVGLPDSLLKDAGIDREAVLVGSLTKFTLWSPDRWARIDSRNTGESVGDLMRRMNV